MPTSLRIATFNLENLDDRPGQRPTLAERIDVMRPQLERLRADILCLQEVNGQEQQNQPRRLLALDDLLDGTPYENYFRASTLTANNEVYDERNLVILSRFEIAERQQIKHDLAPAPRYQKVTASPAETEAKEITWERPILYARIDLDGQRTLHVINVHLKSRIPTTIAGRIANDVWSNASAWAEGSFISAMKRVGQALEIRMLIDSLFDADADAMIAVCGDFNADYMEEPMEGIRGTIENTNNPALVKRVLVPCENTVPEPARFSLYHQGQGRMLDHLLVSRSLLAHYRGTEIHNEILHDESVAFTTDRKFPESDHAPVIAEFQI
ncbi:MAG TPA: endonuclease/exonuclease/phosphatase family protein [Blastocatellia bacterium]|nr:endonuclease/exonuclease/phosphatase family protein [Blastocatellia bacterium]